MRITESRLRQIIQEVMSEMEEQEPSYASYSADLVAAHGSEGPHDYRKKVAAVLRKMPDNYAALLGIALEDPAASAAAGSVEKDAGKILGALMAADALDLDDVVAIGGMLSAPATKMTEGNFEQAHAEEQRSAMGNYKNELESAVYGLLGTYLELYGDDDDKAANAVLADVKNILGF